MEIIKLVTAGSVDDGKSTLIGRLLYDSKILLQDQLTALTKNSSKKGLDYLDFASLTDGLKDEMEQGITIDVAYKYFTTATRKYIIADTPGHIEYTRNFVTAASTGNVVLILIDAQKGTTEQTRRHVYIASLLGIKQFIFCINKMDLVQYAQARFEEISLELETIITAFSISGAKYIPVSALHGDNIISNSDKMDWYNGKSVMETLEQVDVSEEVENSMARFPVQLAIRHNAPDFPNYRAYAGQVVSGIFRENEDVVILPSGRKTSILKIYGVNGYCEHVTAGMAASFVLKDEFDVGRGSIIVKEENQPFIVNTIDTLVCWFSPVGLSQNRRLVLKTTTQEIIGIVTDIRYKINMKHLQKEECNILIMNDIGYVAIKLAKPLICDRYIDNKEMGGLILIDEHSNETIGAAIIV